MEKAIKGFWETHPVWCFLLLSHMSVAFVVGCFLKFTRTGQQLWTAVQYIWQYKHQILQLLQNYRQLDDQIAQEFDNAPSSLSQSSESKSTRYEAEEVSYIGLPGNSRLSFAPDIDKEQQNTICRIMEDVTKMYKFPSTVVRQAMERMAKANEAQGLRICHCGGKLYEVRVCED